MNAPPLAALVMDRKDARTALLAALAKSCPACRWESASTWEEASSLLKRGDLEVLVVALGSLLATRTIEEARTHCTSVPVILVTPPAAEAASIQLLRNGTDVLLLESPGLAPRLSSAVQTLLERMALRRRAVLAETRLAGVQDRVPVGLFRATTDGKLLETNASLFRMFSVPPSRAGAEFHLNDFCPPGQGVDEAMERAATTGQPQSLEAELRRADGQSAWMSLMLF
ncbi:MAG: PAS domain-containing protein, partial [Planctomycetota bacterium]